MPIEDCACEKRCAKNKISRCPGHLASKEAKKRMNKANRKAQNLMIKQKSRDDQKFDEACQLLKYGMYYINGTFASANIMIKYPDLPVRTAKTFELWANSKPQRVIKDYVPYNGKLEGCHLELLEKGSQMLKKVLLGDSFSSFKEEKKKEKGEEGHPIWRQPHKFCPTMDNLQFFVCPLCEDGPASHHIACTFGWGKERLHQDHKEMHLQVKTMAYYDELRKELFDNHFSFASSPEKHYVAPGDSVCFCQKAKEERESPLAQGGVKTATLEAIALREKEVADRRAANALLIKRDQQKAKDQQVLNFAFYLVQRLEQGKSVSLKALWDEKKSSNRNSGDFTGDKHFCEMFDKVASLCPESIRITTTMSGQKFVKCLAPINLGALRNVLGL